jgi:hypothetical protein
MDVNTGPQRPGRRRNCPPWCDVDHGAPLDPVHRGVVASINRGQDDTVLVSVMSDPRQPGPVVALDAWDLAADASCGLILTRDEASELAGVLAVLGAADVAGYLRHAADLLGDAGPGGI